MFRSVEEQLLAWKDKPFRKPLLVRGARQVGKSFIIEKFGREHFDKHIVVNFELNAQFAHCFDHLDPEKIIQAIEAITHNVIIPGKTLLFLDEIQLCPKAIVALRYFKEKKPELHVIAAGSLLEFVIHQEDYQQPVGRVDSLYMRPCSFKEFLIDTGHQQLVEYLSTVTLKTGVEEPYHSLLLERLREYFIVGGMPEAVSYFVTTKKIVGCDEIQASILDYYRKDFYKYGKRINTRLLEKVFLKSPGLIGKHFRYVYIDPDIQARDQKPVLEALFKAGVIFPVYQSTAKSLPLKLGVNEKKFKLLFLDLGLAKYGIGLDSSALLTEDLILINDGELTEQFVGQELIAYRENYKEPELYYWERDKRGSQAEVDYLMVINSKIFPIEVKAGATGRMRSLKMFIEERKIDFGLKLSAANLSFDNKILSVPYYMIWEIERLMNEV